MPCEVPGCEYRTRVGLTSFDQQFTALRLHLTMAHPDLREMLENPAGAALQPSTKAEKLSRPALGEDITEVEWSFFLSEWRRYKRSTGLAGQSIIDQLWACASENLKKNCHQSGATETTSEDDLLELMKKLSIKAQNKMVNVVQFLSLAQDTDEPVTQFISRLKGQSNVCDFEVKCTKVGCDTDVSYSDKMVGHQLVRGLEDASIQEKVLALAATEKNLDLKRITEFVIAQETGMRSSKILGSGADIVKVSEYQRGRSNTLPSRLHQDRNTAEVDTSNREKCHYCGKSGHGARPDTATRKEQCRAWGAKCDNCEKIGHFKSVCRKGSSTKTVKANNVNDGDSGLVFSMFSSPTKRKHARRGMKTLSHMAVNEFGKWVVTKPDPHPIVIVGISVSSDSYEQLEIPEPARHQPTNVQAIADTGAQVLVGGMNLAHQLRVKRHELIPVSYSVGGVDNGQLELIGGLLLDISLGDKNYKQLCYIAKGVNELLLSKTTMKKLGIVSEHFPETEESQTRIGKCELRDESDPDICSCPVREKPPEVPKNLPFPATEENIPKLKDWIVERYSSSAFNCCENQELPLVSDTVPMSLYVNSDAKPVAYHKAYPVPIHWQGEVKAGIDSDVKLGVLEKVPVGEPTDWCSRMVVVSKKDGKPRRTVDFQALNKFCVRQTHSVKAPFHQAMAIPSGTWKTCLDAWNGYHSIPLREEDRHLTTFITPWGRYRYKCLPQGFLAANDGYTARYDEITKDVDQLERCVDDAALWDNTIEGIFFRTCNYLTLCARAGILFSKKKFQFCSKEIDFLGFKVGADGIKPSDEFLEAIRDFPTPKDLTGIRSWFGLVEQCSYAFSKTNVMEPFRHLLKSKDKFNWSQELQEAFDKSKVVIIDQIHQGIKTFDPKKVTCLASDFSKTGIGFHLLQKNCECKDLTPVCCKSGWSTVLTGSRFTNQAESRYAPIEGECLGAAWAMKKCQYFLLGCHEFLLAIDHKPLLGILNNKSLEEIENPRLQRLKEKTLRFNFSLVHVPGRLHKTADATSRQPVSEADNDVEVMLAGVADSSLYGIYNLDRPIRTTSESFVAALHARALTLDKVREASAQDEVVKELMTLIEAGLPEDKSEWPESLKDFHSVKDKITVQNSVILCGERIFIPAELRPEVLEILHSSHGGVSSMSARASDSVWWPGLQSDIERTRKECRSCDVSAPSQPAAPPTPLPSPAYPFEQICADYFSYGGHKYLVIVDRFSNWLTVHQVKAGAGAEVLVQRLRHHFLTYGASTEIATDGGLEFVSGVTQTFLRQWGVHHRLSSAYHPHSNQRAELGVKIAKRIIRDNTDGSGNLENDKFARALMSYRNTPSRDLNLSPAQIIFGRKLRDHLPILPGNFRPKQEWILSQNQRELSLAKRYERQGERLTRGTKTLPALEVGDIVSVQNQTGPRAKKWDKTGVVVEIMGHDQYRVKVDGSGQTTLRNRQFLRKLSKTDTTVTNEEKEEKRKHRSGKLYVTKGGRKEIETK